MTYVHSSNEESLLSVFDSMPPKKTGSRKKRDKMRAAQVVGRRSTRVTIVGEEHAVKVDGNVTADSVWRYVEGAWKL